MDTLLHHLPRRSAPCVGRRCDGRLARCNTPECALRRRRTDRPRRQSQPGRWRLGQRRRRNRGGRRPFANPRCAVQRRQTALFRVPGLAWRHSCQRLARAPARARGQQLDWTRAHVIHYPLRRGELVNFVGIVERDDWQVESWNEAGNTDECLRDFEGWHEDVQTMIKSIATPFKWALMVREPMDSWTVGNITLLGDACHPTLPFLAQGAAMAIEDGYLVARALKLTTTQPSRCSAMNPRARNGPRALFGDPRRTRSVSITQRSLPAKVRRPTSTSNSASH